VLNYGSAVYALASGQTLTGCLGCSDDITVKAYNAATHVIIDVVGYYQDAGVTASTVTSIHGTQVSIPAGAQSYVYGGACLAGTVLVGGQLTTNGFDMAAADSAQSSTTVWYYWVVNHDTSARYADAYSRCMDAPVKTW
jgi:hypothetical protein